MTQARFLWMRITSPRPTSQYESPTRIADYEPGLWRAVITQALMDAASKSRKGEAKRTRADALDWLLNNTTDFIAVCDNAGFDPSYVRTRAKQALARGCEWRLPNGQGWRTRGRMTTETIH